MCITNRKLCQEDFFTRIRKIAAAHPAAIVLREKDLSEREYIDFAEKILNICREQDTACILHSFPEAALELGCDSIHLPLPVLMKMGASAAAKISGAGSLLPFCGRGKNGRKTGLYLSDSRSYF